MSSVVRQILMLAMIPRANRKISTVDLRDRLRESGYDVDVRTIQRDLNQLSRFFPLVSDDRSKPFGWSFSEGQVLELPAMDNATALAFIQAREMLGKTMPGSLQKGISPYIERAEAVLEAQDDDRVKGWSRRVKVVPDWQPLMPAQYDEKVLNGVTDALFERRMLHIEYRRRGDQDYRRYELNPQGLIVRSRVIYLIASVHHYTDILQFALHRMRRAEVLQDKPAPDIGFSLDEYVGSGEADYLIESRPVQVKLRFTNGTGEHLLETPFSADMKWQEKEGAYEFTGTVPVNQQLVWWILGFGSNAEVLTPRRLRKLVAEEAHTLSEMYRQ